MNSKYDDWEKNKKINKYINETVVTNLSYPMELSSAIVGDRRGSTINRLSVTHIIDLELYRYKGTIKI